MARRVLPLLVMSNNPDSCQQTVTPPLHKTQDGGVPHLLTMWPRPMAVENKRNRSFSWAVDSPTHYLCTGFVNPWRPSRHHYHLHTPRPSPPHVATTPPRHHHHSTTCHNHQCRDHHHTTRPPHAPTGSLHPSLQVWAGHGWSPVVAGTGTGDLETPRGSPVPFAIWVSLTQILPESCMWLLDAAKLFCQLDLL